MKKPKPEKLYNFGPAVIRCDHCKGISTIMANPKKSTSSIWYFIVLTNVIVAMLTLLVVKSS